MKHTITSSFSANRRVMIASVMAVLFGTAAVVAQPSSSSTQSGASQSGSATTGTARDANTNQPSRQQSGDAYGTGTAGSTGSTGSSKAGGSSTGSGSTGSSTYGSGSATGGTSGSGAATSGTSGSGSSGSLNSSTTGSSGTSGSGSSSTAGSMTGRDSGASSGKLGWSERRFVTKAAESGMTELQLAQLASQQATSPQVKSFAQKLIQDHTMVNSELTSLAGQKNVTLDKDDPKQDRTYRRLSKATGSEFDQEFVEQMVDMHEADVKLYEKASQDAKDPALKSFAAKHVGHLREHLQTAQSLRSTVMASSMTPTGRMDDSSGRSTSGGSSSSGMGTTGTSGSSGSRSSTGSGSSGTSGSGSSGSSGAGASGSSGTSGSSTDASGSSSGASGSRR